MDGRKLKGRHIGLAEQPDFVSFIFDGELVNSSLVLRFDGSYDPDNIMIRGRE